MSPRLSRFVLAGSSCLALGAAAQAGPTPRDDNIRIEVGPIWNQQDAKTKCDEAARKAGGEWTGDWTTVIPGQSSVCTVRKGVIRASSLGWPKPTKPAFTR